MSGGETKRSGVRQAVLELAQAIALAAMMFALVWLSVTMTRSSGRVATIWPANAVVLVCLLRTDVRRWPAFIIAGFVGNVAGNAVVGDPDMVGVGLALCNTLEILICAGGLRRLVGRQVDLSRPKSLWVFGGLAVLVAPLVSAILATALLKLRTGAPIEQTLVTWALADALGLMIFAPALLTLTPAALVWLAWGPGSRKNLALLAVCIAGFAGIFSQSRFPAQAVVIPVLMLLAFQMEMAGAALGALALTGISVGFLLAGRGPATRWGVDLAHQTFILQFNLAVTVATALSIGSALAERRRDKDRLRLSLAEAEVARAAAIEADEAVRESEARYRLLADHSTDVVIRVNRADVIQYISPSCRRYGYEPEELVGLTGYDLVHPDDHAHLEKLVAGLFSGAPVDPNIDREYRLRAKNGAWFWFEGNPSIVRDEAGAPCEVISQLRDITQRRAMESDLRAARDAAEAAATAKSEFLANMSHEIRTPLTSIMGFSSLLNEIKGLPANVERYLDRIATAGQTLLAVVNDILDFSKLEAGQVELDVQPFDPVHFIEDTVELFAVKAADKGLSLRTAVAIDLPSHLEADAGRVRQVMLNLIGNAVKFTAEGGVTVDAAYDSTAEQLRIAVSDTGVGVPADRRDRLFQRFSQVDGSTSRVHGGTGLGLAISKNLVDLMGGEIGVETNPGEGSTFWFTLHAPVVDKAPTMVTVDETAHEGRPCHILLVDDVSANRELVRAMLSPFSHTFQEADNGADAVAAAAGAPFDLILMDLQMPGMDGFAAARAIRAGPGANRSTPILAISANVLAEHLEACRAAGMDDHVAKPIQPIDLLVKVAQWSSEAARRNTA